MSVRVVVADRDGVEREGLVELFNELGYETEQRRVDDLTSTIEGNGPVHRCGTRRGQFD